MEQVEKGEETRESWSAAGEEEAGLALNEVVCVAAAEEYTDSQRRRHSPFPFAHTLFLYSTNYSSVQDDSVALMSLFATESSCTEL